MNGLETQRFVITLATDGDVDERELCEVLAALGYHGINVVDLALRQHEHPCPSGQCIEKLRSEGHMIGQDRDCCVCWALEGVQALYAYADERRPQPSARASAAAS